MVTEAIVVNDQFRKVYDVCGKSTGRSGSVLLVSGRGTVMKQTL